MVEVVTNASTLITFDSPSVKCGCVAFGLRNRLVFKKKSNKIPELHHNVVWARHHRQSAICAFQTQSTRWLKVTCEIRLRRSTLIYQLAMYTSPCGNFQLAVPNLKYSIKNPSVLRCTHPHTDTLQASALLDNLLRRRYIWYTIPYTMMTVFYVVTKCSVRNVERAWMVVVWCVYSE